MSPSEAVLPTIDLIIADRSLRHTAHPKHIRARRRESFEDMLNTMIPKAAESLSTAHHINPPLQYQKKFQFFTSPPVDMGRPLLGQVARDKVFVVAIPHEEEENQLGAVSTTRAAENEYIRSAAFEQKNNAQKEIDDLKAAKQLLQEKLNQTLESVHVVEEPTPTNLNTSQRELMNMMIVRMKENEAKHAAVIAGMMDRMKAIEEKAEGDKKDLKAWEERLKAWEERLKAWEKASKAEWEVEKKKLLEKLEEVEKRLEEVEKRCVEKDAKIEALEETDTRLSAELKRCNGLRAASDSLALELTVLLSPIHLRVFLDSARRHALDIIGVQAFEELVPQPRPAEIPLAHMVHLVKGRLANVRPLLSNQCIEIIIGSRHCHIRNRCNVAAHSASKEQVEQAVLMEVEPDRKHLEALFQFTYGRKLSSSLGQ